MKILVTGSSGFIGKNLISFLKKNIKKQNLQLLQKNKDVSTKIFGLICLK